MHTRRGKLLNRKHCIIKGVHFMTHKNQGVEAVAIPQEKPQSTTFTGNILLFYAFDVM